MSRGGLSPSRLPKVRDRMVRLLADPDGPWQESDNSSVTVTDMTQSLGAAGLYWATPDMTALAVAAGTVLESVRWTVADRPCPVGLMVLDGGAGSFTAPESGEVIPVDAVSWGPYPGDPGLMLLGMWVARWRIPALAEAEEGKPVQGTPDPARVPPLVPAGGWGLPLCAAEESPDSLHPAVATVARTAYAAWRLMEQPKLAERTRAEVDRGVRRAYARQGRAQPEVTIVDLRTLYRPQAPAEEDGESGRRYSHRWVVRGHWTRQPYGSGRALRKKIWVADYVKGPDGAPLLVRERVNVWRR